MRLCLFDDEIVGVDRLRLMAPELYGDVDPIFAFKARSPFEISEGPNSVTMELRVPFVEKSELDVSRHGNELYIQVGPYRRSFILPDALHRREITKAKLDDGVLGVTFGDPDDSK